MKSTAALCVNLSADLRERARRIAEIRHTSTNQLIRDALEEKVKAFETEERADKERKKREKEEERARRNRGLTPLTPMMPLRPIERASVPDVDPDDALYEEHAKRVLEVLYQPVEREARVAAAVRALKEAHPLTHPPDFEIVRRLERAVIAIKNTAPTAPPSSISIPPTPLPSPLTHLANKVEEVATRILDPTKVKTFGSPE